MWQTISQMHEYHYMHIDMNTTHDALYRSSFNNFFEQPFSLQRPPFNVVY